MDLFVDTHDVISLKFVWHSAVSNASDHGSHAVALLDEIFRADWVIETLTEGNIAEFDTVKARLRAHTKSIKNVNR